MTVQPTNGSIKNQSPVDENVSKIRKALQHWQALELDYEGLKDEIEGLPETSTSNAQLFETAREFGPEKLDDKDLNELFQISGNVRRPSQIVDVLTKRAEYVRKNINTLRKQLSELEKERNAILLAQNHDSLQTEPEIQLEQADITEQLDDDGNVISSHVQRANGTASEGGQIDTKETELQATPIPTSLAEKIIVADEDGKPQAKQPIEPITSNALSKPKNKLPLDKDADAMLQPINSDDTEEEAQLRQEMLQYGLPEVGNIVAELEMAEADEDYDEIDDDDELDDSNDEYDDSEEEDSEDEYGRSTRSTISQSYRRKMEQLQKDLELSMKNVGPSPRTQSENTEIANRPPAVEAARKAALARYEAAKSAIKNKPESENTVVKEKSRKKVAFARSLDIANAIPKEHDEITDANTVKVSRFKAARAAQPQTPLLPPPMGFPQTTTNGNSEGPAERIVAETLVERPRKQKEENEPPAAPDGDDFDEELQKRQIALEHHRLRNKKIHEQGGYVGGGELDNWGEEYAAPTLVDEKNGEPRKISRFKAARLKG